MCVATSFNFVFKRTVTLFPPPVNLLSLTSVTVPGRSAVIGTPVGTLILVSGFLYLGSNGSFNSPYPPPGLSCGYEYQGCAIVSPVPLSISWIRVVGTIEKVCQYRLWCRIAGCLVDDNGGMSIMVKHEISRNKMFFCVWIIYHVESSHR